MVSADKSFQFPDKMILSGSNRIMSPDLFAPSASKLTVSAASRPLLPSDGMEKTGKIADQSGNRIQPQTAATPPPSPALLPSAKRDEIEKNNLRLQRRLDSFLDAVIERDDSTRS